MKGEIAQYMSTAEWAIDELVKGRKEARLHVGDGEIDAETAIQYQFAIGASECCDHEFMRRRIQALEASIAKFKTEMQKQW